MRLASGRSEPDAAAVRTCFQPFSRRSLLTFSASLALLAVFAPATLTERSIPGAETGGSAELAFDLDGGGRLIATSLAYDRAQVAPLISTIEALPHGSELSKLRLDVATPAEVTSRCGEETIACYDPREEQMVIDGQDEELDGVSPESLIAHEYGHHIANNREGGIWSAFDAGTPRWSTYEEVCERTREGLLFPGNEGLHYWENPGESFAQTYATLVVPETPWPYTPLLKPDETALRKVREDVLDPVIRRHLLWGIGTSGPGVSSIGEALPVTGETFRRVLRAPYDGRVAIDLKAEEGGSYRLSLYDATTGELLSHALPGYHGETHLRYADCGHRLLEARAEPAGHSSGFTAEISLL